MTVAAGAVCKIVPTFTIGTGSKAQNVYHVQHSTGTAQTEEDVLDAAIEWVEDLMSNFTTQIADDVELATVDVYEQVGATWAPVGQDSGTWAGTNVNERLPSGVALLIKLFKPRTGYADRKFIAGFTEVSAVGDVWESGILTSGAAFVVDMQAEFTATNSVKLTPKYYNRTSGLTLDYVGGSTQSTVSYQRRRKPGVGLT